MAGATRMAGLSIMTRSVDRCKRIPRIDVRKTSRKTIGLKGFELVLFCSVRDLGSRLPKTRMLMAQVSCTRINVLAI